MSLSSNFKITRSSSASSQQQSAAGAQVLTTGQVNKQNCGTTTSIPDEFMLGNTITVTPTAANTTYVLPTASDILAVFGKDVTTGVPKLTTGDSLPLRFINKGSVPCYLATNPTGGDGSACILYNGYTGMTGFVSYTGAVVPAGKITPVFLEFTNVSGSTLGATGSYTIYA